MQLDRTSIVIRERGFLEILDLALRVVARYAVPLFWCWVVAAIPLMLINYLLPTGCPPTWMTYDGHSLHQYLDTSRAVASASRLDLHDDVSWAERSS